MERMDKLRNLIDDKKPFLMVQEEAQSYLRKNEEDDQCLKYYIRLADEYISNKEYATGINLLRLYYSEYPAIQVAFKLAQSYYENNQLEEAKYWINRTKSDDLRYKVGVLEARILYEEYNWEASQQLLEKVYQKFQQKDTLIEMLGDVASSQGDYTKSQKLYLKLFEKANRNTNIQDLCLKMLVNESKVTCLTNHQLQTVIQRLKTNEVTVNIYICEAYLNKKQYLEAFYYCQAALHQGARHPYLYILHDCLAYRLQHKQLFTSTLLIYVKELEMDTKEYQLLLETLSELEMIDQEVMAVIYQRFMAEDQKMCREWLVDFLFDYYLKDNNVQKAKELLKKVQHEETLYSLVIYFKGRVNELENKWQLAASYYDEASKALTKKLDVIQRLSTCYAQQQNYYLAWTVIERYQHTIYAYPMMDEAINRLKKLDEAFNC